MISNWFFVNKRDSIDSTKEQTLDFDAESTIKQFTYNFPEKQVKDSNQSRSSWIMNNLISLVPINSKEEQKTDDICDNVDTSIIADAELTSQFDADGQYIEKVLKKHPNMPVIIYIHGFYNSTNDVKQRMNEMESKFGDNSCIFISFNWKSNDKIYEYKKDTERVINDVKYLFNFIYTLKKYNSNININFICHSLGNYLLYLYIQSVYDSGNKYGYLLNNTDIMCFAAYFDWNKYNKLVNNIMNDENYAKFGIKSWNHYYNIYDKALDVSGSILYNHDHRAGKYSIKLDNIDNINNVYSLNCSIYSRWMSSNHRYIDESMILDDLKEIIINKINDPNKRKALKLTSYDQKVWKFSV